MEITPRKLIHIGLSFLGSIIIASLIAPSVLLLDKKIASLTAPSKEEMSKKFKLRLQLEKQEREKAEKQPISPSLEKTIQELRQEVKDLEKQRLPKWLSDIFFYFILACSILCVFIGFKMNILFVGLSFINSGLVLLYTITLYFLYKTWEQLFYFNSIFPLILIVVVLGVDEAYISYLQRKIDKEKA